MSVRAAAREAPEGVALADGGRALTWAELAELTDRVRATVQSRHEAAPHQVVAVVGGMGAETVTAILALLEDRVSFVLLHPRWTSAERDRALAMTGASLVIEGDGALAALPGGAANRSAIGGGAVVVFTSGTTGRPRGAVLSHAALRASSAAHTAVFGWYEGDRWLLSLPTAHVGGLMIVVRSLLARRTIVLGGREADGAFDADATLRTIERQRVTLLSVVPTMLGRLLDGHEGGPPASLRAVLVGGAPASPALMARARRQSWPVFATYGLTEACSQVATERPREAFGGMGGPLPGVEVRIAPPDGNAGSVQIRGPVLFDGYLGSEPGAPLDRPFDADGWFDTGDLGALDDGGGLRIRGRRLDRILTGGENVDPTEVEAAVIEWPGAAAACVVGVRDDEWGERVAAVVVGSGGFEAAGGLAGLEEHLCDRLAGFKRPRCWRMVERLPLAPSGKVDRRACRGLLVESGAVCSVGRGAVSVLAVVDDFEERLHLRRRLAAFEPYRYQGNDGVIPALHIDDFTGIPFLDGIAGVVHYQHRARVRAAQGDIVAATTAPSPGYERYFRDVLGLGSAELLEVDPGRDLLAVARGCMTGAPRARLAALAAARGGLVIEPFMGIEVIWELAAAVATDSGAEVRVLAPPPPVAWIANDKASFEDLVTAVLGPGFLPASRRSASAEGLARGLLELAEASPAVALKRLRCASAMGNEVFESTTLRRKGSAGVLDIVRGFLERTGWDGSEEVLAVAWEESTSSPSTQWWLPPPGGGGPRLDGVYEQILAGEEGVFVGSRPSGLPSDVEQAIVSHSGRVAAALQGMGYVGRCSFDHLVLPQDRVVFTECNGRWGGTSTPMNLVDRLYPEGRPAYQAQGFVHRDLAGLSFEELLARLGASLCDRGIGAGRFLLYNVGSLERFGKFDVVAIGSSREHVDQLMTEELPGRLELV